MKKAEIKLAEAELSIRDAHSEIQSVRIKYERISSEHNGIKKNLDIAIRALKEARRYIVTSKAHQVIVDALIQLKEE